MKDTDESVDTKKLYTEEFLPKASSYQRLTSVILESAGDRPYISAVNFFRVGFGTASTRSRYVPSRSLA